MESIKKMLSTKGVVTPMTTGFVYVRDIPSRVKMVREMLETDIKKRKTITMRSLSSDRYKDVYRPGSMVCTPRAKAPSVESRQLYETMGDSTVATLW